jgi:hypothetical protein
MSLVIARQGRTLYLGQVVAALFRLLAIAAIILMPLSMGIAPAAAAVPSSHASMKGQEDGHCGQKPDNDSGKAMAMQCTGSCSALPCEPASFSAQEPAPVACLSASAVKELHGVMLPLSTPPPRLG